jgi:predicted nucleic acid-binding protein
MTDEAERHGLLDTNIMILRSRIAPDELPEEMAISAVTLAELSAGPHEVRPDTEQDVYFEAAERARRLDVLQRAEHEFDPIPFDADAARAYGRVTAAVVAAGRKEASAQGSRSDDRGDGDRGRATAVHDKSR